MKQYLDLLRDVHENGRGKADRTGTGTRAVFGRQIRMNLADGFPLLTTKKVFTRGILAELLWFLSGDTNEHTLRDQNVNIWKEWTPKGTELDVYERLALFRAQDPAAYQAALREGNCSPLEGESYADFRRRDEEADIAHYVPILDAAGIPTHGEGSGDLGRIYSAQWRGWRSVDNVYDVRVVDQISNLIRDLKTNPTSRRHIVTAWNPGELDQMALPPCHCLFQFYCEELAESERRSLWEARMGRKLMTSYDPSVYKRREDWEAGFEANMRADGIPRYRLSCQLYQRSADIFLGVPFNIASYAALTMMIAQCVNMVPGEFVHTFGDLHIYNNHTGQVEEQLQREPRPLPKLTINPAVKDIFSFKMDDFKLEGYDPHPAIKAEVSV